LPHLINTAFIGDFVEESLLKKKIAEKESLNGLHIVSNIKEEYKINSSLLPDKRYFKENKLKNSDYEFKTAESLDEGILLSSIDIKDLVNQQDKLSISGPLEKREIIFLPDKPQVPTWLKDEGQFHAKFKIYVDREGQVVLTEKIISSGFSEIDILAQKYLRRIRFSKIYNSKGQDLKWAFVEIKMETANDRG
jgi:hypothetical protein